MPNTIIGSPDSGFWLHTDKDGFDLTHPPLPESPLIYPRVKLRTTTDAVTIDPSKTALVIVDMQNFFLSPALGRAKESEGLQACEQLLRHAIPAARSAGIRVIWLNWGLTQSDIDDMPPATLKSFGFRGVKDEKDSRHHTAPTGLGSNVGLVTLEDGTTVEGGRLLMRDQWNSALFSPLEHARQEGMRNSPLRKDLWIHKDRMSGLWGSGTLLSKCLEYHGIKTLILGGVNTDQCVGGTLQDAYTKGYDCLLLRDGSATTTPKDKGGQSAIEYNTEKVWGFMLTCSDLEEGVKNMIFS